MRRTSICLHVVASICLLVIAAFHLVAAAQAPVARGLSLAWSLDGRWTGVASDEESGAIYSLPRDRVAEVDLAGQIRREFELSAVDGLTLRLGKFPRPTLLTFSVWGSRAVHAIDIEGNRLWSYPALTGIDAITAADVDEDGSDEVVVGYNGSSGVHVLDGKGQQRWKSTASGNVWQVAVGDVLGQGRPQVVTSAFAKVQVFGADGKERVDVAVPRAFINMVRVGRLRPEDSTDTMLVAGNDLASKANVVIALSTDGTSTWRLELPGSVHTAQVASARPWLALGTRDGQVYVVDAVRGEILGVVDAQGGAEVGWVGTPPLLLVATGTSLNAFHVTAK